MFSALYLANILALLSTCMTGASTFFKSKRSILLVQAIECIIGSIAQILAKSFAGATELFICAFRNYLNSRGIAGKSFYWILSGAFLIFGLITNNRQAIGFLPIFACIQYTLWTAYAKTGQQIRIGLFINFIPWIIHDYIIHLYTSSIIQLICLFVTAVNIFRNIGKENKTKESAVTVKESSLA